MRRYEYFLIGLLVLAACHKDDNNSQPPAASVTTQNQPPNNNPPPNTSTGTVTNPPTTSTTTTTTPPTGSPALQIYTDDLHQGGAFLFPGGENQSLTFNDISGPATGSNSIRYSWNGGDVAGQHIFAGVDLIHSGSINDYNSTPPKDLRSGRYTRVTFNARGTLGANVVVKIEAADDGNTATPAPCIILSPNGDQDDTTPGNPIASCLNRASLLNTWQSYTLGVMTNNIAAVKDYFKATFIYKGAAVSTGTGGTLFLDQILYQP